MSTVLFCPEGHRYAASGSSAAAISKSCLRLCPNTAAQNRRIGWHFGGRKPLGADVIQRQDPRTEPNRTKKSPAPRFHAIRKWVRQELYQTYTLFVQAYREAAERLRSGDRTASFPAGSFPPS